MKKSRHLGTVSAILTCALLTISGTALGAVINNGGTHTIDYEIGDGLSISGGSTVTLEPGANISGVLSDSFSTNDGLS